MINIVGDFNTWEKCNLVGASSSTSYSPSWTSGALLDLKQPLISLDATNTWINGDPSGAGEYGKEDVITGFMCKNDAGAWGLLQTKEAKENFTIINRAPVLWSDYEFYKPDSDSDTNEWQWINIESVSSSREPTRGFIALNYYADTSSPYYWGGKASSGTSDTAVSTSDDSFMWIDGWGLNDYGTTTTTTTNTPTPFYDADEKPQIGVGNQTKITSESLTNSERSGIININPVIEARVGFSSDSNPICNVKVYIDTEGN